MALTLYEKGAALAMLNDLRSVIEKDYLRVIAKAPTVHIIAFMNALLIGPDGSTHWRYGTPTMFMICAKLCEQVASTVEDDVFYMSHMPRYEKALGEFCQANVGNVKAFTDLIDVTIKNIEKERTV